MVEKVGVYYWSIGRLQWLVFFSFLLLLFVGLTSAGRLPTIGGDSGSWGTVLNEFLNVSLDNNTGNIRSSIVNTSHIVDGTISLADHATSSVNTTHIVDGTITTTDISASAGITDGQISDALTIDGSGTVNWTSLSSYPNACTNQFVTTIGDTLTCASVTADSITDGVIANADISNSAAIALSKLATGSSANIVVLNDSGIPAYVSLSGDGTISSGGTLTVSRINGVSLGTATATSANILIANGSHWITRTIGTDATISNTGALTIASNAVALGADTTNNYVATLADNGGGVLSVSNSGTETAAVTIGINADTIIAAQLGDTIDLGAASEGSLTFSATGAGTPGTETFSFVNSGGSLSGGDDIMSVKFTGLSASQVNASHTFISFQTANGEQGDISGTSTGGLIAYNTFTGSHWSETDEQGLEEGEVLVSTGVLLKNAAQLTKTARTTAINDKRVYGVYGGLKGRHNGTMVGEKELIQVLSLGTGVIRVTDTNGNINNGDLITTSTRAGYGQKQNDDLMHSYTVAKATQSVDWTMIPIDPIKGFKWKLIAATYHAG